MNDRNTDLFFNEDNEEVALITLNDEEGNEVDAALMAVFQIEEVYSDEEFAVDRKSTRLNSSHSRKSRMPSSA